MRISIFLVTRHFTRFSRLLSGQISSRTNPQIQKWFRRARTQAILRVVTLSCLLAFYQNCGGNLESTCSGGTCDESSQSSQAGGKKHSTTSGTASRTGSVNPGSYGTPSNGDRGGTTPGWSSGGSTTGRPGSVSGGGSGSSSSGGMSGGISGGVSGGYTGGYTGGGTGGVIGGSTGGVTSGSVNGGVTGGTTAGGTTTGNTGGTLQFRIATQPQSQEPYEYASVKVSITMEGGKPPYSYAWTLNNAPFTGSYTNNAAELNFMVGSYMNWKNQGDFKVTVTDSSGASLVSNTATIAIKEASNNCAAQDYFNITETRPEILQSLLAPDSPSAENVVPVKNFFVTPLGTKYLLPLNFSPFSIPGMPSNMVNPISMFLNNSYVQKSGWSMPATNHGGQLNVACSPAVNGGAPSNWLKDFNEFPDNPDPLALYNGGYGDGGSGPTGRECNFWDRPQECARINTTYALRGNLVFECHNNKYKYVSGSCSWEALPQPPPGTTGGGSGGDGP